VALRVARLAEPPAESWARVMFVSWGCRRWSLRWRSGTPEGSSSGALRSLGYQVVRLTWQDLHDPALVERLISQAFPRS
jgi:hypothetical protein